MRFSSIGFVSHLTIIAAGVEGKRPVQMQGMHARLLLNSFSLLGVSNEAHVKL
jgi:hypothetical protein